MCPAHDAENPRLHFLNSEVAVVTRNLCLFAVQVPEGKESPPLLRMRVGYFASGKPKWQSGLPQALSGRIPSNFLPCRPHPERTIQVSGVRSMTFDLATFLENAGVGRKVVHRPPKQDFFLQGSPADSIFYLRTGRAKLTVVSPDGKEATVALLSSGEFMGEESLASVGGLHLATAAAIVLSI